MNTATTIHLGNRDAIRVEGRTVSIQGEDGSWLTLRPEDAVTCHRLETCFGLLREALASEKRERVALLERVEGAA